MTQRRLLAAPLITLAAAVIIGAGIRYPILLLAVFWFLPWDAFSRPSAGESWWRVQSIQKTARVAAVLAVLALGGWFRFHDLDVIPSDPTSDHAEKLLDITDVLNGDYHVFFPRNTGREAIQFYLTAFGLVRLLDMEPVYYTVKVSIALLDTLAVLAVFLLARELGGYAVGLSASFLFATNAWAVSVGRFGLRPAIGALTAALTIGLLLRYLRTGHLRDALLCGASIGFGLYGYSAFRTVPIAVAGILLLAFLIDPRQRGRRLRLAEDGVVMALTAVVFLAPLLRFITEEWSTFWYRTSTRTTSAEVDIAGEPWRIFLDNNLKMLKPFNWQGMDTIIQFVVGVPLLDVITGALLLAGTILLIIWAVRERSLRYATPLLIFPVLALSSTLSIAFPNEVPSSTRSALLSPFILTAAAMPIGLVLRQAFTSLAPATARALMMVSAVVFFGVVGYVNYDRYFVTYRDQFLLSALPTMDISRSISTALDAGVPIDNVYLANVPYWIDNRVIGFELQDLGWAESHNIAPEMTLPLVPVDQPSFYVLNPTDVDRIALLEREYPDAVVTRYEGDYENRFYVTIWNPGSPPQE